MMGFFCKFSETDCALLAPRGLDALLTYSVNGRRGGWRTLTGVLRAAVVGAYHTNEFKVVSSSI